MSRMKLGWIGTAAFQAFTEGDKRELVFDLADGQSLPPECKEGDAIDVVNRPDHPASIATGTNSGYYEVKHIASGVTVAVKHKTSSWRFEP